MFLLPSKKSSYSLKIYWMIESKKYDMWGEEWKNWRISQECVLINLKL